MKASEGFIQVAKVTRVFQSLWPSSWSPLGGSVVSFVSLMIFIVVPFVLWFGLPSFFCLSSGIGLGPDIFPFLSDRVTVVTGL